MKSLKRLLIAAVMTTCLMSLGCTGLTVGPQVRTEYVIVHPGKPFQVLENKALLGKVLDGTNDAKRQDVGGWVMMPPDHWDAVKRTLEKKSGEQK